METLNYLDNHLDEYLKLRFFHGTNSGSLPGIKNNGGMLPTWKLIEKGIPPFAGELHFGIINTEKSKGSNADYISGFSLQEFHKSLGYADDKIGYFYGKKDSYFHKDLEEAIRNGNGLETLEMSKKHSSLLRKKGKDYEELMKWQSFRIINFGGLEGYLKHIETRSMIHQLRLKAFSAMSDKEKYFVNRPFPMVVTTELEGEPIAGRYRSTETEEVGLSSLLLDNSIIFTPQKEIENVGEYLENGAVIHPIDTLKLLHNLLSDSYRDPSLISSLFNARKIRRIKKKFNEAKKI